MPPNDSWQLLFFSWIKEFYVYFFSQEYSEDQRNEHILKNIEEEIGDNDKMKSNLKICILWTEGKELSFIQRLKNQVIWGKSSFFRDVWRMYCSNLEINDIHGHKSRARDYDRFVQLLSGQRAKLPLKAQSCRAPWQLGRTVPPNEQKPC